ncbi:helix-turn-helix transcriptional regulator [Streptomyces sp. NBC_00250]|uniref:helix-turn-helix domain-containing protein n=1 Tax=Streptomyces sp. NBC_00250 TaxID=2903641 RepID=UPI002E29FB3E|nr:helix-turn-helix transcriptional regulator [Streptomyces sp. NBC_00250]
MNGVALDNEVSRQELAHFLRTRRESLSPADVDLPNGPRRRTPGLRREEVAALAGLSLTWYTLLEQGRNVSPSFKVLDSLAGALNLAEHEREYIHQLVHSRTFPQRLERRHAPTETALQQVADSLSPNPAYVVNKLGDILGWNEAAAEWYTDFGRMPEARRNLLWWLFTAPEARVRLADWRRDARDQVGRLRAVSAGFPGRSSVSEMVEDLKQVSCDFRTLWGEYRVLNTEPQFRRLRHPRRGTVPMRLVILADGMHPSLEVVYHLPQLSGH